MATLLIGSNNPAKVQEFRLLLNGHVTKIVTPQEVNITEHPEEDGETFAENSLLKANFYWQKSGLPTLTDDGGLEVDALGGRPGVHSRRWDGQPMTDEAMREKLLTALQHVPEDKRTARLTTVVTLRINRELNFQAEASIRGLIRDSHLPHDPGYPFRPLLWIPELEKFYSHITPEELLRFSHRKRAVDELLPYIDQYL